MRQKIFLLMAFLSFMLACAQNTPVYVHSTEVKIETMSQGVVAPTMQLVYRDISDQNRLKYVTLADLGIVAARDNVIDGSTEPVKSDGIFDALQNIDDFANVGSINGDKLTNGTVSGAKISDGSIPSAKLQATGVSPGSYVRPEMTVNAQGQIVSVVSGTASPTTDENAIHDNVAGEIIAVAEKVAPVSADVVLIEDSEDGNSKKRVEVGNLTGDPALDAITQAQFDALTQPEKDSRPWAIVDTASTAAVGGSPPRADVIQGSAETVTSDGIFDALTTINNFIPVNHIDGEKIEDNGITAAKVATNAVTTVKIANDAVTNDKIGPAAVSQTEIASSFYDTGTFTPTLTDVGGGATYTANSATGSWTKVGNQVLIEVDINIISTTGTPTGEFRIGNLPTPNGSNYSGIGSIWLAGIYMVGTNAASGQQILSDHVVVRVDGANYATIDRDFADSANMSAMDEVGFVGGQIKFTIICKY